MTKVYFAVLPPEEAEKQLCIFYICCPFPSFKIESEILCQMNNWIMTKWIIDTFLIHMKYNGSFSMLTYTLVSSVKVSINGCSFTDIHMKFRNVCMLSNRTLGVSVTNLLRVGVYLSVVPKCILPFSLMETVLLLSSREDAAHPSALVVAVYTHF